MAITPYPVMVPRNGGGEMDISLTLKGKNTKRIEDIDMKVTLQREFKSKFFGLGSSYNFTLPCILEVGSCTYNSLCSRMNVSTDPFTQDVLNMMHSGGMTKDKICPFQPAEFTVNAYQLALPALPTIPLIARMIDGRYYVRAELRERSAEIPVGEGDIIGCFEVAAEVKKELAPCRWWCWRNYEDNRVLDGQKKILVMFIYDLFDDTVNYIIVKGNRV
jgi:hypothetical protein